MTPRLTSLALFTLLAIAAPLYADLIVPKVGPRPPLPPNPPKQPAPPQTLVTAPADVLIDKNGQQVILELPRGLLNQIKQAALEEEIPDQAGFGDRRTMAAGIALSLAIITGGLWLSRRSRTAMIRTAFGLGLAVVVLGAGWALANGPAPPLPIRPQPPAADGKIQVSIRVVNQGDTIRLHIPGVLVQEK